MIADSRERETRNEKRFLPLPSAALLGNKSAADNVDTQRRAMGRPESQRLGRCSFQPDLSRAGQNRDGLFGPPEAGALQGFNSRLRSAVQDLAHSGRSLLNRRVRVSLNELQRESAHTGCQFAAVYIVMPVAPNDPRKLIEELQRSCPDDVGEL